MYSFIKSWKRIYLYVFLLFLHERDQKIGKHLMCLFDKYSFLCVIDGSLLDTYDWIWKESKSSSTRRRKW